MQYTLRQLEVFVATAHFQNITKAAESLAMSQSAASGALKDLESQFNIQLFDRVGKRLQTNALGERIRVQAEALLGQAEELEDELLKHEKLGHLRVGATLTIGNYLCVDLMNRYLQSSKDARVSLEVANTSTIAKEILNFEIDLGLIEGEYQHPNLDIVPWQEDELVCFCAPDHPLAQRKTLSDEDIQSADWILREKGSGTRQTFNRAMQGISPQLKVKLELQHTEAIKRAVENGLGISCLSKISVEQAFERGSLVPLVIPHRDFSRTLYFVIHKQKYRDSGILHWMKLCGLEEK